MNNKRRKEIKNVMHQLEDIIKKTNEQKSNIEFILSDEEYSFDCIPENLKESLRAEASEDAIDHLESSLGMLSDAIDELSQIIF